MGLVSVPAEEDPSARALAMGPGWIVMGPETPEGVMAAVSLHLSVPAGEARCFPHLAALCVCQALGVDASIHWPCNIMLTEKPVCGVRCRVGEGVIAALLTWRCGTGLDIPALTAASAGRLRAMAADFPDGRENMLQDYCNRCVTLKKGIDFLYRGVSMNGYAFAVDRDASLMVLTESRTVLTLRTGPVKLAGSKDAQPPDMPNPCRI